MGRIYGPAAHLKLTSVSIGASRQLEPDWCNGQPCVRGDQRSRQGKLRELPPRAREGRAADEGMADEENSSVQRKREAAKNGSPLVLIGVHATPLTSAQLGTADAS